MSEKGEKMSAAPKRYYKEREFCEMYGITRQTASDWRKKKMIGFIRTPTGLIRYRQSDIDEYDRRNGHNLRKERKVA